MRDHVDLRIFNVIFRLLCLQMHFEGSLSCGNNISFDGFRVYLIIASKLVNLCIRECTCGRMMMLMDIVDPRI